MRAFFASSSCSVFLLLFLRLMTSSVRAQQETQHYTATDDRTWAIVTANLTDPFRQRSYDEFMQDCRDAAGSPHQAKLQCDQAEDYRLHMNGNQPRSVRNYTQTGFLKVRAPQAVFSLIHDFWIKNRDSQSNEWDKVSPYHNTWDAPPTVVRVDNASLIGGGRQLQAAIANAAREAMEEWTGVPQISSSVYGIRIYHNNSVLTPHCDRMPLISSAIINVDQDVDEPWFLEVYDHAGVAHNVSMAPGDLVLYESHSVIHGRPFPMKGKYYANIFVHFEPLGPPRDAPSTTNNNDTGITYPPYLIPDSSWAPEWQKDNPQGWKQNLNPIAMVERNDMTAIRYLGSINPSKLIDEHDGTAAQWKAIHEAARLGYVDILKYLIEEHGANPNEPCFVTALPTPLALAHKFLGENHEASQYLQSVGGVLKPLPTVEVGSSSAQQEEL